MPVAAPRALITACPDPRFAEATHCLIHELLGLGFGEYIRLSPLGSVIGASGPVTFSQEFRTLEEAYAFCFGHFPSLDRNIVINHDDCARYKACFAKSHSIKVGGIDLLQRRQLQDIDFAGEIASRTASRKLCLEAFYLRYANAERTHVLCEPVVAM